MFSESSLHFLCQSSNKRNTELSARQFVHLILCLNKLYYNYLLAWFLVYLLFIILPLFFPNTLKPVISIACPSPATRPQDSNFWLEQSSFNQVQLGDKIAFPLLPFPIGTRNCLWGHPGGITGPNNPREQRWVPCACTHECRDEADENKNISHLWLVVWIPLFEGVGSGEMARLFRGVVVLPEELALISRTIWRLQQCKKSNTLCPLQALQTQQYTDIHPGAHNF